MVKHSNERGFALWENYMEKKEKMQRARKSPTQNLVEGNILLVTAPLDYPAEWIRVYSFPPFTGFMT